MEDRTEDAKHKEKYRTTCTKGERYKDNIHTREKDTRGEAQSAQIQLQTSGMRHQPLPLGGLLASKHTEGFMQ